MKNVSFNDQLRGPPLMNYSSQHTLRSLPLPGLGEVRKEEEPAPPLVANQEQRSVLLTRLLEDRLQTPAE